VKILRLESTDIVRKLSHEQFDEAWYLNLDCVVYLQELRHKPTSSHPNGVDSFHVSLGGGINAPTLSVTKEAFEKIRAAMESGS